MERHRATFRQSPATPSCLPGLLPRSHVGMCRWHVHVTVIMLGSRTLPRKRGLRSAVPEAVTFVREN